MAEYQDAISDLERSLHSLTPSLESFLQAREQTIAEGTDHLRSAEYNATSAYALVSLAFAYMRTTETPVDSYPIQAELMRIKSLMNKVKAFKQPAAEPARTTKVNQEAADRVIKHHVGKESQTVNKSVQEPAAAVSTTHATGRQNEPAPSNKSASADSLAAETPQHSSDKPVRTTKPKKNTAKGSAIETKKAAIKAKSVKKRAAKAAAKS